MNGSLPELCRGTLQVGVGLLLQSSLLLALGLVAGGLLRRRGPEVCAFVYQVTLGGVVLGVLLSIVIAGRIPPLWAVTLPAIQAAEVGTSMPVPEPPHAAPASLSASYSPAAPQAHPARAADVPQITSPLTSRGRGYIGVVVVWLCGSGLLLLWLAACQWHLVRLRRGSTLIADGPAFEMLTGLSASRTVRPPLLLASPHVRSPFLAGVLRPAILLPANWETDYDEPTQYVILAHETAHLARRDCAWTLLLRLTCAAVWPQPLLWLLARQWEQASEEACDLLALTPDCPPKQYADCLLSLAERSLPSPAERMLGASVVPVRSSVGRRIQQVLLPPRLSPLTRRRRITILASVCIGILGALSLFGIPPPEVPVASFNWAKQQGWSVQPVQAVNLASPQGVGMRLALGLRGDFPSAQDLVLTQDCNQASLAAFWGEPKYISMPLLRAKLQQILARHPHFFYAEYWMSESYQTGDSLPTDDPHLAAIWLSAALHDAPAILAGRCEYNDGRPVIGFNVMLQVSCGPADDFLCFKDIVTDQDGCYYLPVFRGLYTMEEESCRGEQVKNRTTVLPYMPSSFVSNAHVGVLPPFKEVPLISLNTPFNGKAYTNGKSLRVHGPTFHLSWKPYPGAVKYDVIISEIRPYGSINALTGYNGQEPHYGQTTKTDTTVGLLHDYADFFRDYDYMISIRALDSQGQMVSESNDYTFRPVDAQVTRPLTRTAIQDALAHGGDAHITTIQRKGGTVTVVGTIPKSNWLSQPHARPEIEPVYLADVSNWQLGKEVSPGVVSYRMTITLSPNAKSSL